MRQVIAEPMCMHLGFHVSCEEKYVRQSYRIRKRNIAVTDTGKICVHCYLLHDSAVKCQDLRILQELD